MVEQKILEEFVSELKPETKEKSKTYSAIVSKIDKEGTVWVRVAGSDKDTPTALVGAEVKKGDAVNVEWRNNKLYIASNYSTPAAGVVRVEAVEQAAALANEAANNAITDAGRAKEAADSASASADQAQKDAGAAKESAENAGEYAARALGNLSTVQSVTETLNWITQHGTMTLTTDTSLDPTHVYFVRDNDGDYVVGNYHYSIVTEPKLEDISTYYVLSIDESLNNYVGTHLAVTSEGLWLLPDAGGNKVLIATGGQGHTYEEAGTYLIDSSNTTIAKFTESSAVVGKQGSGKGWTTITSTGMSVIREYMGQNRPIAKLGFDYGNSPSGGSDYAPYATFGVRIASADWQLGNYSVAEGLEVMASGGCSHAEGAHTQAGGHQSHAEGAFSVAGGGISHAEGFFTKAKERCSHAQNEKNSSRKKSANSTRNL